MANRFHVTSTANRASIRRHGLDWSRTGAARGIAGSYVPEVEGCFLAEDEWTADCFVRMNNTGGPVDVWEVAGVDAGDLLEHSGPDARDDRLGIGHQLPVDAPGARAHVRDRVSPALGGAGAGHLLGCWRPGGARALLAAGGRLEPALAGPATTCACSLGGTRPTTAVSPTCRTCSTCAGSRRRSQGDAHTVRRQ